VLPLGGATHDVRDHAVQSVGSAIEGLPGATEVKWIFGGYRATLAPENFQDARQKRVIRREARALPAFALQRRAKPIDFREQGFLNLCQLSDLLARRAASKVAHLCFGPQAPSLRWIETISSARGIIRRAVARPKLLQEVGRRNKVARLEALRKSVEDRVEKFERFVTLGSTRPESCEADANTQL
jgi:hypothetical protein